MVNQVPDANAAAGPIIFTDFDGTITQVDVTDEILTQLAHPSWQEVEQEWTRGLIGSRECLQRQIALVNASLEDLHGLIDAIPIDPAFSAFYCFTRKRKIPLYVLSEGFDYVIARVLKRIGVEGAVQTVCRFSPAACISRAAAWQYPSLIRRHRANTDAPLAKRRCSGNSARTDIP